MAANVVVRLDQGAINTLLRGPSGPVVLDLRRRGQKVLNRARTLAPVDTGNLRASLRVEMLTINGDPTVAVGTNVKYAVYVHEGTSPHRIQGNPRLVFFWPKIGRVIGLPYVNHPGTTAQPFLLRALDAARD